MKILINALSVAISIIISLLAFFKGCTKDVICNGVVLSHTTTSDKYGNISYYTVASFEDRKIRSLEGLEYYVIPVNGRISYTSTVMK
jgi:hypothetical protein